MEEYEVIETVPEVKRFTCKALLFAITFFLYGLPFLLAFFGWLKYDLFIGFCFLCSGYLLNGVIHSKIRQVSVPPDQTEISFSSFELARWFVSNYIVCR